MTKNFKMPGITIAFIAFVLVSAAAVTRLSYVRRQDDIRYRQMQKNLEKGATRNLPTGSSKATVLQFLKEHSIASYDFDPNSVFGEGAPSSDRWYEHASESVQGSSEWIGICRLEVEFKFDKNHRLLGYRDKGTCKDSLF